MPSRRSRALPLLACVLVLGACTSASERRAEVEAISLAWVDEVDEDGQEDLIDHARALADADVHDDPTALASLTLLTRQAHDNLSSLVKAECLAAAWRLAAPLPAEPVPAEGPGAEAFSARSRRFEELIADPATATGPEAVALAAELAAYRAPAATQRQRQRHPIDLAQMVVSRVLWEPASPVRDAFAAGAAGSARHALVLVTLYAADDLDATVREQALRAARHLEPSVALDLIAGAFTLEVEGQVLHAGLDSLAALGRRDDLAPETRARLAAIVGLLFEVSDVALAGRARDLAEELDP